MKEEAGILYQIYRFIKIRVGIVQKERATKTATNHGIIDRIAEELCRCAKNQKLWSHPNLAIKFLIRVYTDLYINGLHNKNRF